jgi:DNA-binding MarR family transcriptional regulator
MSKNGKTNDEPAGMSPELVLIGHINEFNNRFQAAGDTLLDEVSWKQVFTLRCVALFDQPPTIKELGEFTGSSHQNIKQILLKLEKAGFVALEQDEKDRRKLRVILTEKASKLYESNTGLRDQYISKLFEGITGKDIGIAIGLFRKLDENLDEYMAEKT